MDSIIKAKVSLDSSFLAGGLSLDKLKNIDGSDMLDINGQPMYSLFLTEKSVLSANSFINDKV